EEVLIQYDGQDLWCPVVLKEEDYFLVKFQRPTGYYVLRFSTKQEFQTYFFVTIVNQN
ncbi:MAG: hypothetical protein ACI86H_001350, partial [bacterium]